MNVKQHRQNALDAGSRLHAESLERNRRRVLKFQEMGTQCKRESESFRITKGSHQYLNRIHRSKSPITDSKVDSLPEADEGLPEEEVKSPCVPSTCASTQASPVLSTLELHPRIPTPSPRRRRQKIPWSSIFSTFLNDLR